MLLFLTLGISGFAQNTLTVADGTTTNEYVPVYGLYVDELLRCQTIYPSSMLTATGSMTGEGILGVTYYLSSSASASWGAASFVVKVMEVTDTVLTAFVDMTNATTVYTGSLDGTQSTMEISFTTPYTYQGGNLLIEVSSSAVGTWESASFYGVSSPSASWQGHGTSSVSAIAGSVKNFIPKTTFSYGTPPTCFKVTNLAVDAAQITANSVTLTWTDALNTGATYNIYDMSDTSLIQSGVTGLTCTLTGLNGNTAYTFGVQTDCGGGDIAAGYATVEAHTACVAITLPYTETFESNSGTISCWSVEGPGSWAIGTGDYSTTTGSYQGTQNALITHTSTGNVTKLVSPILDGVQDGLMLDFAYVMRSWAGDIDELRVYSRADVDSAWQLRATYTDAAATWTAESITIPGTVYQVAFEYTDNYGYGLGIDNVAFTAMSSNFCYAVSNLVVDSNTTNTISISWSDDNNTGATYNIYDMSDTSVVASGVSATNYEITGLTANTIYTFGVETDCGGGNVSANYVTVNARTACDAVTLPYIETFESTSGTRECWELVASANIGGSYGMGFVTVDGRQTLRFSSYSSASDYNQYGFSPIMNVSGGATNLKVDVTYATYGSSDKLNFGYVTPTDTVWDPADYTTTGSSDWQTVEFIIPVTATQVAIHYYGSYSYYGWIDTVAVTEMTGDYCYAITNLAVDSITATSVSISWSDDNNSGATYTIYNMADSSIVVSGISATNYEITGLTASTTYTFGVEANCSATSASTMATVGATTYCAAGGCQITIEGHDSFGDGWNGNAITIVQGNDTLGIFTLANGSDLTKSYIVCSDAPVTFFWTAGSYPGETSFGIYNGANFSVYTGGGSSMTAGLFYTLNDACPTCLPVTALTVDNADETSITISWTGTAASYDLYLNGTFETNVATNTYTFSSLATSTAYTIGVQAICSATDSASMVTIGASTECPDVTTLPYNEGFENGLGCWSTINASSDGQPWTVNTCSGLSNVNPHGGAYVASSWSWSSSAMHANAWLISPKFVLPNVTNDSLTFAWWENTNPNYQDSYSVLLSTTTKDTAAFTTVVYPYAAANGDWTMKTVNLTAYAGQTVYLAFHHVDYDENYLLIDDISLFQGAYVPPAPDTLTVTFAVNDVTMGTTVPAPGTYQYISGDTVSFHPEANTGYHFNNWEINLAGQIDTLASTYVSVYFLANSFMSYGTVTLTALFEADSTGPVTNPTVVTNAADNIAQTTATLHATITNPNGETITAKGFEWKATTGGTYTQIAGTGTGNTFTADLTGLTANTNYTFKAFITFNGTTVYGDEQTFTTLNQQQETCEAPTNLRETGEVIDKSVGYLFVEWDNPANVTQWNLQYKLSSENDWNTIVVSGTPRHVFENLEAYAEYNLRVQSICDTDNLSGWSNVLTAIAQGVGIEDHTLDNSVTVYPNPTSGVVQIENGEWRMENVEVYDAYGKLLFTVEVNGNAAALDLTGYAKGIYFVKVTTDNGVVTKRVVKN